MLAHVVRAVVLTIAETDRVPVVPVVALIIVDDKILANYSFVNSTKDLVCEIKTIPQQFHVVNDSVSKCAEFSIECSDVSSYFRSSWFVMSNDLISRRFKS